MEEKSKLLHIVMFPWFAVGHINPFFRLSKSLARKGHRISLISTPKNLARNVKIPQDLAHLIHLITFPFPRVEHLPPDAESSMDVPSFSHQQLLKIALDMLQPSVRTFLHNSKPKPDWIIYDYASHWLPQLAAELGIPTAYFSLFTAAFMAFLGPPASLMCPENARSTAEDYTVVPEWIPFPTDMAFRLHEMNKNIEKDLTGNNKYDSGVSDSQRFGHSIDASDIVIFRSCEAFEPEWFDLVRQIYQKPVIPLGVLPPEDEPENDDEEWETIKKWLDSQLTGKLVYVALGTEAALSQKEAHELAFGLEKCGFPFFWVVNRENQAEMLPQGFVQRVSKKRGFIYTKWAPQIKILAHPAVGGFLTHCGWNSVTEGLGFGRVLILFPVMNDQGLNARLLQEKKVGLEVPRNEEDGSFTSDSVAETLRMAMVSGEGKVVRENAERMKRLFGDKTQSDACVDSFVSYLMQFHI